MQWLDSDGQRRIHTNVLRILAEVGLEVQHPKLLEALAGIGAIICLADSRARFPADLVEGFIAGCPKVDYTTWRPSLVGRAGVFLGDYLHPDTNEMMPFNEQRLCDYFRLGKALPHITSYYLMSCQWPVNPLLEPLYERLHAWGAKPCVWQRSWCHRDPHQCRRKLGQP